MEDYLKIIIGITSFITIIFVIVICITLNNKYKNFVLANSERLNKLLSLNKSTHFHQKVKSEYFFSETLNSKRKFDNTKIHDFVIVLIENNYDFFKSIIKSLRENIEKNKIYISKYNEITSTATKDFCEKIKTNYKKFIRYENSLFKSLVINPIVDTKIILELIYTSPQGRNSYNKEQSFHFYRFENLFHKATYLINSKKTREYQIQLERSKMSDSLRYDILRRDGFKCQICGITASDGANLHVDHIVPVSKGGKTEPSNLRTLCERCNMGKSDKIE